ncbi:MAG: hypothetical protein A2W52_03775 [Candidatus Taylorbacteria bacterium RIFCSPHIGHO2_02_49_25]|uniref:Homing endonuclease LAGLIDADG domain-containing protein n=1 Tax=Candidatus Taylorbacteria bacterium RIFCSPHIGHO2_02_49_25 TaxID=1802305 RepID=A0A1G2MHN0_9BACT|nr:MAG: hypothetical protein A2W52_03775 [Candidatus Taylorbacteria bacterium RIFCSPHIGHO2_02_49_25]OHA47807.1 MAG: hypothetical protein A3G61_03310 [Candidatus Taylorbacteria bacterium RIFCSPLOWO2_12_FULL_49_67]
MTEKISSREKEILIGTILGDAHIAMLKTAARLEVTHSEKQKEYVLWKHAELKHFMRGTPRLVKIKDARYGKTYRQWRFATNTADWWTSLHRIFYRNRIKIVPENIADLLTSPLSLAVWFMDDGGRRNDSYGLFLNTLSFTLPEQELLQRCLQKNFSLETRIHWIQDGYRLYIPSNYAKHFCETVYPNLIPSMYYKLSFNPVTTSFARLDRARDRK